MNKAAIIYWSGTGNTEAMAQAVLEGAQGAGADAKLHIVAADCEISVACFQQQALQRRNGAF